MTTRKPRIAIVAASLDILGGQGVQAHGLLSALERDGWPVTFVPIDPRFPRGLRWIRRVPGLRTLVNQALYAPGLVRLAAVDVAHVFSASYWSFLLAPAPAMLVGRAFGKRVVLHYHSGEADDHLAHWGALVHPWLRLAHEIVVPSEYLRRVFARHGHGATVVENVVELARFQYRERRPLRPRVLSTRNLEAYYRVDAAIEAFARFRAVVPDATLTVAGYGSREPALRALAARVAGGAIRFVGKVDPNAMPRLYADHDIYLNASELDNQPVSILEAMASGLAVVTTTAGDIPFMLRDGETALLVPPGNSAALGDAMCAVWRDRPAALARARRANREVVRYTWPSVRDRWAGVYTARRRNPSGEQPFDEIAIATHSR
jgi:glycosyltransferase involved in cell wall biosynthesis